jgi:DNA-binding NarL/FixJ family response regulator
LTVLLLGATLTAVRVASPATKVLLLAGDARRETIAAVTACGPDGLLARTGPAGRSPTPSAWWSTASEP